MWGGVMSQCVCVCIFLKNVCVCGGGWVVGCGVMCGVSRAMSCKLMFGRGPREGQSRQAARGGGVVYAQWDGMRCACMCTGLPGVELGHEEARLGLVLVAYDEPDLNEKVHGGVGG